MNWKWYSLITALVIVAATGCVKKPSPQKEGTDKAALSETTNSITKSGVIAPGAKVEKLAGGFKYTEGPAVDNAGNLFFTDSHPGVIYTWSLDGKLITFHDNKGWTVGLYFDRDGNLLACEGGRYIGKEPQFSEDYGCQVVSFDQKGNKTVLADSYNNNPLNAPNDLWIDPRGGVYFTDPYWGEQSSDEIYSRVYYLSPNRKELTMVTDDMEIPNGLVGNADGTLLYVSDNGTNETYVFTINADGTLSDKRLFVPDGYDGMTIDSEGNVYITGKVVSVYDPAGTRIETIEVPETASNLCFGGSDNRTLFITAHTSLYAIKMRVQGL